MFTLYLNNFRGFDKTYIPIKKITFFVGENSTGKTSILKLLKILSSPNFVFSGDLNGSDIDLGYFDEISSKHYPKRKYFEVGILENEKLQGVKYKYTKKEAFPFLTEINLINDKINIQFVFKEKNVKYRYRQVNLDNISDDYQFLTNWFNDNGLKNKSYVGDDMNEPFTKGFPNLYFVFSKVEKQIGYDLDPFQLFRSFSFTRDITWFSPIRTEPRRTYDSYKSAFDPSGAHMPYLLKNLLTSKSGSPKTKIERALNKFGKDSGLFQRIKVNILGKSDTSPFEVQIQVSGNLLKITNVGYGLSQILPLIIEIISRPHESWFAIQQPEIHLHPKAQAAFGDLIYKSADIDNKFFIIETHSDYLIDRYRLKLNQKKRKKDINEQSNAQIVFFNRKENGNQINCIEINSDGSISDEQPTTYKEFFIKEELDLIKI